MIKKIRRLIYYLFQHKDSKTQILSLSLCDFVFKTHIYCITSDSKASPLSLSPLIITL